MDGIKEYVIRIIAAALLCGILTVIFNGKGTSGAVIKFMAGIFMILTMAFPLVKVRFDKILDITDEFRWKGVQTSAIGEKLGQEEFAKRIIQQTEAYILDKAENLGVQLCVEVYLSEEEIPVPATVHLKGKVSPLEKSRLTTIIEENLGISAGDQTWIGS